MACPGGWIPEVRYTKRLPIGLNPWYTSSMKIYLDTCSLQRPLDNKTQLASCSNPRPYWVSWPCLTRRLSDSSANETVG